MLTGYPSIYAVGHKVLRESNFFCSPVLVEEKVDGSQFSFGVRDGVLHCRSKGTVQHVEAPDKLFTIAIQKVCERKDLLHEGWTYRAEYLRSPKHNTLAYDRVPNNHLMIFDIDRGEQDYLCYSDKKDEAERLGFECVNRVYYGILSSNDEFKSLLDKVSSLGGAKIEGVVAKSYNKLGPDKKILIAKYVSEAFKEIHQGEWKKANPSQGDITESLIKALRTPARWNKAVQHLRESNKLTETPRDIGILIQECAADIKKECEADIRDRLFSYFWPRIQRGVIAGLPEWYKEQLVKEQFLPQEPEENRNEADNQG